MVPRVPWQMCLSEFHVPQSGSHERRSLSAGLPTAALVLVLAGGTAQAQQGPFLYAPNVSGTDVSVIDSSSNTALPAIAVGVAPFTAAVSGDESLVYVVNSVSNTVTPINTVTNTAGSPIAVGADPLGVVITPDAKTAYVANADSSTVSVINVATNTVVATIPVGNTPSSIAVTPDGKTVYVAGFGSGIVTPINTATNTAGTPISVGGSPQDLAVTPDGKTLYVANALGNTVTPINTATNTAGTPIVVGSEPRGVAISPDGKTLYVANSFSSSISVINIATNTVVSTIRVDDLPWGLAISPDGKSVYVTIHSDNTVQVIATATNTVVSTLPAGLLPSYAGICSNGNALLASGLTFKAQTSGALACTLASGPTGSLGPVFTGGTLQIAGTGIASSLPLILMAAGGTIDTNGINASLSGPITGPGGLTKIGAGTLTLSGASTYTGSTAVNVGTLQAGAANAFSPNSAYIVASNATLHLNGFSQTIGSLAGSGNVTLAAATLNTGNDNTSTSFLGTISGVGGSLNKIGTGTFTLSGASTYTGGTTFSSGILAVQADSNLGDPTGGLTFNGGTLQFLAAGFASNRTVTLDAGNGTIDTNGNDAALSNTISGPGGLTKTGAGTLALSGAGSYLGPTAVNAGTLQAGATGVFSPDSAYTVASGATVDLNSFNQIIGSLAGLGSVTLGAATLATGNDGTSTTFGGNLSGTGGLVKIGSGTLMLSAANNYSGVTNVNAGVLDVTGSIASSALTTVANGAALTGTGTVGATQINSGGTFAPGSATPGSSMTVAGNLAFQSGALYLVQLNSTTASFANVAGTASLAGTVQLALAPGATLARQYDILHSAGLNGTTFAGSNEITMSGFAAVLSYTPTDVLVRLNATLGANSSLTVNQQNVAAGLSGFFNNGGQLPANFVGIFGLSGAALGNALTQLSGEAPAEAEVGVFKLTDQFLAVMLNPFVDGRSGAGWPTGEGTALGFAPDEHAATDALAYAGPVKALPKPLPLDGQWGAWGAAFGGSSTVSGDAIIGSHDVSAGEYGFASGLDYHFSADTVAGFAMAGGGTNWSLAQQLGGGRSDALQAGVYGASRFGAAYIAAALAFANHWMTTDRLSFAADHLTSSFTGQDYAGRLEGGYRFAVPVTGTMIGMTPYAALQAQSFHTPGFAETDLSGLGFALQYAAQTATDTRGELGARFDDSTMLGTMPISLRGRIAWAHDWVTTPALAAVFETLPGAGFTVNGVGLPKDSALVSAGVELHVTHNWSLATKFDGELASGSQTWAGMGTIRYVW